MEWGRPQESGETAWCRSNREYYRMVGADEKTVIGVVGTSRDEDHAFIYLAVISET